MYNDEDDRESAYKDMAKEMEKSDLMARKEVANNIKNIGQHTLARLLTHSNTQHVSFSLYASITLNVIIYLQLKHLLAQMVPVFH
jgi:hypothetical protein